jgi:tetratricopeptide (TPR) repeat protein
MMSTKIYTQVHALAEDLMDAVQKKSQTRFDEYYAELKQVCEEHEDSEKDHPVQWETLADFTDDYAVAIELYDKALLKAEAMNVKDFRSSIGCSIAKLKVELGEIESAIEYLENAKISCNKIPDKELKAEIHDLLEELKNPEE